MEVEICTLGGGGVHAIVSGPLAAPEAIVMWRRVAASLPADCRWALLDVTGATIPFLDGWPGDPDVIDQLHPVVRSVNADLAPDFRLAVVSDAAVVQDIIADLVSLVALGPGQAGRAGIDSPTVRWLDDVDEAVAWASGAVPTG